MVTATWLISFILLVFPLAWSLTVTDNNIVILLFNIYQGLISVFIFLLFASIIGLYVIFVLAIVLFGRKPIALR